MGCNNSHHSLSFFSAVLILKQELREQKGEKKQRNYKKRTSKYVRRPTAPAVPQACWCACTSALMTAIRFCSICALLSNTLRIFPSGGSMQCTRWLLLADFESCTASSSWVQLRPPVIELWYGQILFQLLFSGPELHLLPNRFK